jgi:hypothetical protein
MMSKNPYTKTLAGGCLITGVALFPAMELTKDLTFNDIADPLSRVLEVSSSAASTGPIDGVSFGMPNTVLGGVHEHREWQPSYRHAEKANLGDIFKFGDVRAT